MSTIYGFFAVAVLSLLTVTALGGTLQRERAIATARVAQQLDSAMVTDEASMQFALAGDESTAGSSPPPSSWTSGAPANTCQQTSCPYSEATTATLSGYSSVGGGTSSTCYQTDTTLDEYCASYLLTTSLYSNQTNQILGVRKHYVTYRMFGEPPWAVLQGQTASGNVADHGEGSTAGCDPSNVSTTGCTVGTAGSVETRNHSYATCTNSGYVLCTDQPSDAASIAAGAPPHTHDTSAFASPVPYNNTNNNASGWSP